MNKKTQAPGRALVAALFALACTACGGGAGGGPEAPPSAAAAPVSSKSATAQAPEPEVFRACCSSDPATAR